MLLEGLTRLKVSPTESVYVGDMIVDVQTGRAAGVPVWIVAADGLYDPTEGVAPDRILQSFAELPALLISPHE
jgi:phosphoglycolate phosphatase